MTLVNHSKEQRIFVYFPYQFSTMKVFQNSNYRVLMAVPTPRFFKELMLTNTFEFIDYAIYCKSKLSEFILRFKNWTEYFDVYDSKYKNMHLQFDNWQELFNIIMDDNIHVLKKKYLLTIDQQIKQHSKEMDEKWTYFFKLTGFLN